MLRIYHVESYSDKPSMKHGIGVEMDQKSTDDIPYQKLNLMGYGSTREQAIKEFQKKYSKFLEMLNEFKSEVDSLS